MNLNLVILLILILFVIECSFIIVFHKREKNINNLIEKRNEEFKSFIYFSIMSYIDSVKIFVDDIDEFFIYSKSYIYEKINDDIKLDGEFNKFLSRYPSFSLYEYISDIIDNDIGFKEELTERFNKTQPYLKDNIIYENDKQQETSSEKHIYTDITKELFEFTK